MVLSMLRSLNPAMAGVRKYRKTFIRPWRKHRGLTLEQLAERMERIAAKREIELPTTPSYLSMLERGQRGYIQETLEGLAEALETDVASLLTRDPADPESIWTVWGEAKPAQRRQIVEVVKAIVRTGTCPWPTSRSFPSIFLPPRTSRRAAISGPRRS